MSTQAISASGTRPVSVGHGLPPGAIALMLMLCVSWGFNQLAVKLALPDVPPMLQALIRSSGALPVMLIVGHLRGVKFFERDGTLVPGIIAGLMFGCEFVLIFTGLVFTSASRASVFLYTAPFFVALGSHQFLGERLSTVQWSGLALSFAGVALAIGVPGTVAGLALALEKYGSGKFTLAQILKPAIDLARDGFIVTDDTSDTLSDMYRRMSRWPNSARAFSHADGTPLHEGDRLIQGDLAGVLTAIAEQGPRGFYEGAVAEKLVSGIKNAGGIFTLADLKSYQPVIRAPIRDRKSVV